MGRGLRLKSKRPANSNPNSALLTVTVGANRKIHPFAKESYGIWHCLPVLTLFVLATLFTDAHFFGDTADYVDSIIAYAAGRDYWFWEFGHVLWRPLGWAVMVLCRPLLNLVVGPDVRTQALHIVLLLNWLAGLVSVLALYGILNQLLRRWWAINLASMAFIFSHGFLNYTQTGCAYIPGLALLLVSLYVLVWKSRANDLKGLWGVVAGLALAGAFCMWVPYVLAAPGILAAPLLLGKDRKGVWKLVLTAAVSCGLITAITYLSIAIGGVGISDLAGFRAWMAKTAGGPAQDKAIHRMIFGFARSFIFMGKDGMLFKRFLVADPFNPVSAFDLLRLSLWKIGLFYLFMVSLAINLLRSAESRRIFWLLIISSVPIIGLAVYWQGGDIERYLALYPMIFISLGACLYSDRSLTFLNYVALTFVAAMVLTNATAMAKFNLSRQQEGTAARAHELQPLLRANSRVFAVTFQDDFVNFNRSFPFHPVNRFSFNPYAIVAVGTTQAPVWRQDFSAKVEEAWKQSADVWVSRRVLSPRPRSEWNWVEGDDKSVSWTDIFNFFSKLEMGRSVGGEDGFALLPPSEKNREVLSSFRTEQQ